MIRGPFILVLDYRNRVVRFGAVGVKRAEWLESVAPNPGSFRPLAKAFTSFGLDRRQPTAVVVTLGDRAAGAEHVSWSTVRAAIATANTLAFAWHVPSALVRVSGAETPDALAELARRAAAKAKVGSWVKALYDGEPNITVAKTGKTA